MENITYDDKLVRDTAYFIKPRSLVPANFSTVLNEVMSGQALCQGNAQALLLQKDIALAKLPDIKQQQSAIRTLVRDYQDSLLPTIRSFFTGVSGFFNEYASYYETLIALLCDVNVNIEAQKKESFQDVSAGIEDLMLAAEAKGKIVEKFEQEKLQFYIEKNAALTEEFKKTQELASNNYTGDKTEIDRLEKQLKVLEAKMAEYNACVSRGALDKVSTILKIIINTVSEVSPKSDDQGKEKNKDEKESKQVLKQKSAKPELDNESIPLITSNLELYEDDKPVKSSYVEALNELASQYKELVSKVKKYSLEIAVLHVIEKNWEQFIKYIGLLKCAVRCLVVAWQDLANNLSAYKNEFSDPTIGAKKLDYLKEQLCLTHLDLSDLRAKCTHFETASLLAIVNKEPNTVTAYGPQLEEFANSIEVPAVSSPQLSQSIINKRTQN